MLRRRSRAPAEPLDRAAVEALEAALADLQTAVSELRGALGGADADSALRLHRLEQRLARLEDLSAAAPGPAAPVFLEQRSTPVTGAAPATEADQLARAIDEDRRQGERAQIAAARLGDKSLRMSSERFASVCDRSNLGLFGDLDNGGGAVLVHVVEGGPDPLLAPGRLLAHLDDGAWRRIVVRDIHRSWLHRGVPGAGSSPAEVAMTLSGVLAEHDHGPVIVFGAGAAGFGAILLGTLIDADRVLAVDAPTTLDRELLSGLRDARWDTDLAVLDANGGPTDQVDLVALLADGGPPIQFDYGVEDPVRRSHAERLRSTPGVTLVPRASDDALAWLLDEGRLAKLLRRAAMKTADAT